MAGAGRRRLGCFEPRARRTTVPFQLVQEIKIRAVSENPQGPAGIGVEQKLAIWIQKDVTGVIIGRFICPQTMFEEVPLPS